VADLVEIFSSQASVVVP